MWTPDFLPCTLSSWPCFANWHACQVSRKGGSSAWIHSESIRHVFKRVAFCKTPHENLAFNVCLPGKGLAESETRAPPEACSECCEALSPCARRGLGRPPRPGIFDIVF